MTDDERILIGMIQEIAAKAKLLRQKLHDRPDQALSVSHKTRQLELEMADCLARLFPTADQEDHPSCTA